MKKLIGIILLICFTTSNCAIANAIALDFLGNKTTEELLSIRADINKELNLREVNDGDLINEGSYTVGLDIRAGRYECILVSSFGKSLRNYVRVYLNDEDYTKNKEAKDYDFPNIGAKEKITIKDGEIINFCDGIFEIKEVKSEKTNWAP